MDASTARANADGLARRACRVGAVSFLNARPLICGLESCDDVELTLAVPSELPELLDEGRVDVALVPVVDLLGQGRSWKIVSDACIGCDGETLTVRVFSTNPPDRIRRLWADPASHTSVALARLIWQEMYDRDLEVRLLEDPAAVDGCEAVLLIGDRVVTSAPYGFAYQADLGGAWKALTGLPFVFAAWAANVKTDLGDCPRRLSESRDRGVAQAETIADQEGPRLGWPPATARDYLTRYLSFTLDARHREGMTRFLEMAGEHDIVPARGELTFA